MALITLYGLAGQFAVFVVTSEIHSQLRSLEAVNAAVSNELAARLERGENPAAASLAGLRKRDPAWSRRQVCAWYGEKPLPLCNEYNGASLTLPVFVKGKFRDLVRERDELHLESEFFDSDRVQQADGRVQRTVQQRTGGQHRSGSWRNHALRLGDPYGRNTVDRGGGFSSRRLQFVYHPFGSAEKQRRNRHQLRRERRQSDEDCNPPSLWVPCPPQAVASIARSLSVHPWRSWTGRRASRHRSARCYR